MIEIWKDIEGFCGFYRVSNYGRVKSIGGWCGNAKRNEKIISISYTKDGYQKVRLIHGKSDKTCRVHRLVANAFLPNTNNKKTVNHIDGNKKNNNVENLEWADRSEQMYHAYKLGLKKPIIGCDNINSKLTPENIKYIRNNYVKRSRRFGTVALGKMFNVSNRVIGLIVNNKTYKNVK